MCLFNKIAWLYAPLVKHFGSQKAYYEKIKSIIKPEKNFRVLDVGGGTGIIAEYFSKDVKQVIVLDPSEKMMAHASGKIKKIRGKAEKMPFKDREFDIVYCVDSLHHFTNGCKIQGREKIISDSIKEMLRVLKRNGCLVIIEIDPKIGAGRLVDFFENKIFRLGSAFYRPEEIKKILEKHSIFVETKYVQKFVYVVTIRFKSSKNVATFLCII